MFFDIFSALCEKKGVSRNAAAKQMGLSNSTVTKWKNTNATPSGATLAKVADYFGVSVDYLLGITPDSYLLWSEYRLAIAEKAYDKATDQKERDELALEIDGWRESIDDQKLGRTLMVVGDQKNKAATIVGDGFAGDVISFPVIGGVAAGYDHIAYEDWTGDSIDIPRSYLHGRQPKDYFVLRVEGDSMYPEYQDGDHVLVFRQTTMDRSGQVGVVVYGDENATLKRVEYVPGEDWVKLCPINPQYPPVTIRDEALTHCTVLGVAKLVVREVDKQ